MEVLKHTESYLEDYRSEEKFFFVKENAVKLAETVNITADFPEELDLKCRKKRKQLDYESVDEPIRNRETNFRINFYNAILDTAINSITDRFEQLQECSDVFGFLFHLDSISADDQQLMKYCADLEVALSYEQEKDIVGVDLFEEIKSISRRLNNFSPKTILSYIVKYNCIPYTQTFIFHYE